MVLFADDVRRVLQNLPVKIPKGLINLLALDRVRCRTMQKEAMFWLQAVNGDPVTGRTLKEINAELFADDDEEANEEFDMMAVQGARTRLPKPIVTIEDPPSTGMPRAYLDGLSEVEFAPTSAESRNCLVATRWEVRGKHTGTLLGVPPTGKAVTVAGVTLMSFVERPATEDGREAFAATEEWTCWDLPSLLEQLRGTP